jgi:plastocyanin
LRGFTYIFNLNASGHPWYFQTVPAPYSAGNVYSSGVTGNGTEVGTVTFAVPFNAPSTLYYVCQVHSAMSGTITVTDATGGGSLAVSDDTTTNATRYPVFEDVTSGTSTTMQVSSTKLQFNPSTGTLSATIFTSLSDRTQKTDIEPIQNAIETVKKLEGVKYKWKDSHNKPSIGVIAQDIEKVLPEVVNENPGGLKSVSYGNIVGLLIEAIKEQQVRIEKIEDKLDEQT